MDSGPTSNDYFAILEIGNPDTTDEDEVKRNYRRLALSQHPDKNPNDPNATAKFQRLQQAHETLTDPEKLRQLKLLHEIARNKPQTSRQDWPSSDGMNQHRAEASGSWSAWVWTSADHRPSSPPKPTGFGGYARMPAETRSQRAEDQERAAEAWRREEISKKEKLGNMREDMRTKQKEINQKQALEREEERRRKQEEAKKQAKQQGNKKFQKKNAK